MDKWVASVVITAAVVMAGIGLLLGIGIVVERAVAPLNTSLQEIVSGQKDLLKKRDTSEIQGLLARVESLEARAKVFEAMGAAPAAAQQRPQRPQRDLSKVYEIPVGSSAVLGKATAPITITMFNDFQCPFCSRFYPAAVEAAKAYPDKVKLVMKHFPLSFHPNAAPASKAALAAGVQGKFYEMTDLLFQNNKALTEDKFKELAGQLKLDVAKFMKDLKERDAEWQNIIKGDMDLGSKVDVGGTPAFYLNGKMASPGDANQWKAQIDAILSGKPLPVPQAPQGGGGGGCGG